MSQRLSAARLGHLNSPETSYPNPPYSTGTPSPGPRSELYRSLVSVCHRLEGLRVKGVNISFIQPSLDVVGCTFGDRCTLINLDFLHLTLC